MLAAVLHGIGDLRVEEAARPEPGPGRALVKVGAAGICGSDVPRVWQKGTYHFPTIPGHEFAGTVAAVGEGVGGDLVGKRVAVFPLIPCMHCPSCQVGEYAQCDAYDYLGSRSDGGFAEYVAAPAKNLVPVPDGLSLEEAAMCEPAAVAIHALRRGGVDLGDAVAVLGAGPIGLLAAQAARAWGAARVMLTDIDERKLAFARDCGFEHVCGARREDVKAWTADLTHGRGADLVLEAVGAGATYAQSLQIARKAGRVVWMGNPAGPVEFSQANIWEILRKQLTVAGTWNSSFADLPKNEWELALSLMESGRLAAARLITHRFPLSQAVRAFELARDKSEFYQKIMFTF